jgi:chromosome segregation ATPase
MGSALLCSPAWLNARQLQDQPQENVVEAARKAQSAKKTAPKAKLVIDNDNLGTLTGVVNVVGQEPAPPADQAKPATDDKTKAAADDKTKAAAADKPEVKDEAYWRKQFADANKKLTDDAHELDVLQREYNLKEQQYYTDPNTAMREQFDRKDLTDTKKNIDEKTEAVTKDKQDISDLEDELRKAGGDAGWARPQP